MSKDLGKEFEDLFGDFEIDEDAIREDTRRAKISQYNKVKSAFKDPAIKAKSMAKKRETGSYLSIEKSLQIYNDPLAWSNDRLYGAIRALMKKYQEPQRRIVSSIHNEYGFVNESEHEKNVQEWKETTAERWVMYSPSIQWLDLYDELNDILVDQQKSKIPPSDVWKARQMEPADGKTYLFEKFGDLFGGGKNARDKCGLAIRKKFDFLDDVEPQRYVFYTLEEAKTWSINNIEGVAKTVNLGRFFLEDGKNVAWKAPGLRGWIFERENRNAKGRHRHQSKAV